ncbi:glycopeptide antibiotics resistance protein [Bacillus fengqiuensis]|nr:glycopeptide antibiotics resistance protein [Bacillus fengqiuensis]
MSLLRKSIFLSVIFSQGVFFAFYPLFSNLFSYLHPIVLGVVWVCLTLLVFFTVFWIRKDVISIPYSLFVGFLALYTISLLVLLFVRPTDQSYTNWNLEPFSTILFYLSGKVAPLVAFYNLAANIGLFIPYGIFLMIRKERASLPAKKLFYGALFGISIIELTQFLTRRGSLDIDDLLLNLVGVYLGYILFPVFKRVVHVT